MRWSRSPTCSLNFAPVRLPQGGDQPNLTTIDNDIASHGTAATTPFGITENHRTIHAELSVRFPPFQLYEFPVMRTIVAWRKVRLGPLERNVGRQGDTTPGGGTCSRNTGWS